MKRRRVASATALHCASPTLAWSALHCARSSFSRSGFAISDSTDSICLGFSPQAESSRAMEATKMRHFMVASSLAVEVDGVGRVRRAIALEASAYLAGTLLHGDVSRLLQRGGPVLRDLKLLRLNDLPGMQGQQLVRRLRSLQGTDRRLAAVHEVGQGLFVGREVLHRLRLHFGRGAQCLQ